MPEDIKWSVQPNRCNCHPETCGCNDWIVTHPDSEKKYSFFRREDADDICSTLNELLVRK